MENITKSSIFADIDEEIMAKLPKVDETQLGVNAFINDLVIQCTKVTQPDKYVRDEDGTLIPASYVIEKQKAMKIFRYPEAKSRAMNMSAGALRMFVYIQYSAEAGKDWILMTPEQYARAVGKGGRNAYKNAKDELWRYGYILPTMQKYVYWLNPNLMYAGDRIRKWPDNVIVKSTWEPPMEQPKTEKEKKSPIVVSPKEPNE